MANSDKYMRMWNGHAFKRFNKCVEVPRTDLAIGDDEVHNSLPIAIFSDAYVPMNNKFTDVDFYTTIENEGTVGDDTGRVDASDFASLEMFLGSPVGVF